MADLRRFAAAAQRKLERLQAPPQNKLILFLVWLLGPGALASQRRQAARERKAADIREAAEMLQAMIELFQPLVALGECAARPPTTRVPRRKAPARRTTYRSTASTLEPGAAAAILIRRPSVPHIPAPSRSHPRGPP